MGAIRSINASIIELLFFKLFMKLVQGHKPKKIRRQILINDNVFIH